jgi:alcohol dehydrogenase (cytochrome c)
MDGTTARAETTPIVVQGIMYVTSGNECWALDAGAGREIWHFQRPRTKGLVGNAAQGVNRGVAWLGDRVFMVTDNAHILALNRFTATWSGRPRWRLEAELQRYVRAADWTTGHFGTAGGEQGRARFVAAYDRNRKGAALRTVPKPGEPGSETWGGKAIDHPSGVCG